MRQTGRNFVVSEDFAPIAPQFDIFPTSSVGADVTEYVFAMLSRSHDGFHDRARRLQRKHRRMMYGRETWIGPDGLLMVRPRARGPVLSVRGLFLLLLTLMLGKAALYAHLGPVAYGERVTELEAGGPVERAGAWAMHPGLATQEIASVIAPYLP
ncbi:hypothetical protein SAMN04488047_10269 [Tranquillimonas alkanivorans]|uniref:Uncharacterized protein n=2 Tax=Tranquillimonas alkanivorans TaxID=441119 RepID=A0A1I5M395_9RHOB|nr:hypothetical protein SAMN04488047_10269 [Tranquillimonas alkanivorans]